VALSYAVNVKVAKPESILPLGVALVGCEAVVVKGLVAILSYPYAQTITLSELRLRLCMALLGCEAVVVNCLGLVLR